MRSVGCNGVAHQVGCKEKCNCHLLVQFSNPVSNRLYLRLAIQQRADTDRASLLRCPITIIPSFMYTEFLYQSSDFTWLAVHPTVWLQISYNLAIITACIPTMKNVFDGLSGNFSAEIDAPYTLTSVKGARGMRLEPSVQDQQPSQAHSGSGSHDANLRLHTASPSQAACYSTTRGRCSSSRAKGDNGSKSESVQNLTGGVVLVTAEVDVQFETDRPSSNLGSYTSWDLSNQRITGTQ